jgi:hypothetical protein
MKNTIGNLINLTSFGKAEDALKVNFADDAAGTILARNLEVVDPTIFKQQYAGLTFLQGGIQISNIGGWGEFVTKIKRSINGDFSNSSNAANGIGKISISAESDTIPVFYREAFSEWTDEEIKQAEMEGRNLVSELMEAHNEVYNRNIDTIGYTGQLNDDGVTLKTEGLLNFSGFTSGAGTQVGTGSAEDDYNQIKTLIVSRRTEAKNNEVLMPTNVVFPTRVFEYVSSTILNTAGTGDSILEALQKKYPSITFGATSKAEFTGGAATVTVCYSANPRAMVFRIPTPLEIGEILKPANWKFKTDSRYRVAGLDVIENAAAEILTGL